MKLSPNMIAILRTLRAGEVENAALPERVRHVYQPRKYLNALLAGGLIYRRDGYQKTEYWGLTPKGRAACPPRNPAAALPKPVPLPAQLISRHQPRAGALTRALDWGLL